MKPEFKHDIFSRTRPIWKRVDLETATTIRAVFEAAVGVTLSGVEPEQVAGLEINSNNYRVRLGDDRIAVLKKSNTHGSVIARRIGEFLNQNDVAVPVPIPFSGTEYEMAFNGAVWSLSEFIEGDYFTGIGMELENASKVCSKIFNVMQRFQFTAEVTEWEGHILLETDQLLADVQRCRSDWPRLLGQNAIHLDRAWPDLMGYWQELRVNPPDTKLKGLMHFDLHPHNLLYRNGRVAAVLDLDSFRMIPVGIAIAFAGLKLCRQTAAHYGVAADAERIGNRFLVELFAQMGQIHFQRKEFAKLAQIEIFRRICLILRLNIYESNSQWNHVLPIQINNLYETEALFSSEFSRYST